MGICLSGNNQFQPALVGDHFSEIIRGTGATSTLTLGVAPTRDIFNAPSPLGAVLLAASIGIAVLISRGQIRF